MRSTIAFAVLFAAVHYASSALAQDPAPSRKDAPPAHVGFQMALRTGYSIPFGNASGTSTGAMSNLFGGQVPIYVDIGGKPIPNLFIGGYFGLGFGGPSGMTADACTTSNLTCVAVSTRFGVEAQFHALPSGTINPWIGYGIGFESSALAMSNGNETASVGASGIEFAHFTAGIDGRLTRVFGIGGFVGLSVGEYSQLRRETGGVSEEQDIPDKGTHECFTLGLRTVFFP